MLKLGLVSYSRSIFFNFFPHPIVTFIHSAYIKWLDCLPTSACAHSALCPYCIWVEFSTGPAGCISKGDSFYWWASGTRMAEKGQPKCPKQYTNLTAVSTNISNVCFFQFIMIMLGVFLHVSEIWLSWLWLAKTSSQYTATEPVLQQPDNSVALCIQPLTQRTSEQQ